jgi:anti-sigma factor RsiW
MTDNECARILDLLPEWVSEGLDPADRGAVEGHLATCGSCLESAEVIRSLVRLRPEPPAGLENRIQTRVREEFGGEAAPEGDRDREQTAEVVPIRARRRWVPAWALSAAALLVVGIGTKILLDENGQDVVLDPVSVAAQDPIPEAWLWDDGIVAGGLVLDGLTEEDLEALLEEFGG